MRPLPMRWTDLLWLHQPLASCRIAASDHRLAAETPIWVDHLLEHQGPAAVLINLHASPPPFFSRFERLAEIVGVDEARNLGGAQPLSLLSRTRLRIANTQHGGVSIVATARELLEQADALMRKNRGDIGQ